MNLFVTLPESSVPPKAQNEVDRRPRDARQRDGLETAEALDSCDRALHGGGAVNDRATNDRNP